MPTTANRAIRYPLLADIPDVPLDMSEMAADLDRVASIGIGTLAARPIANATVGTVIGNPMSFYYASDTVQLFLSVAGAWVELNMGPAIPIGASMEYGGNGDPTDARFLLEDGRLLARAGQYAPLFAAIGTTYGAGDGSTTFAIPDCRGRTVVSPDNMGTAKGDAARLTALDGRGNVGGVQTVTLSATQSGVPAHSHDMVSSNAGGTPFATGDAGGGKVGVLGNTAGGTDFAIAASTGGFHNLISVGGVFGGAAAAASSHDNMMPYVVKNRIIRVK